MIMNLKPYLVMKASGAKWLGEVPEHWKVIKLRSILRLTTYRNRPDLPLLSVVREKGVIVRDVFDHESNHNYIPDDLSNYKVVREGQFAMNKMKAWQGSFGVSQYEGIVSPAYFVFDLKGVSGDFFNRAIRSRAYVPSFTQASDGVRIGQWDLSQDRMREIGFTVPPLPEQTAIVRYLGHVDKRVRRLMQAKRRLIALLNEQKQAIIYRAVTCGLNPDVSLKDSGIEFLGKVPEHWEVRSLTRSTVDRADYRGATPEKVDFGVLLVTAKNIRKGWIDYEVSREYVAESCYLEIMRRGLPKAGDLLLTMEAPLGHAALVDNEQVALAQRVIRFRMNPELFESHFVLLSVLSQYVQDQLLSRGTGSTATGIKASKLPQIRLLKPSLEEQRLILKHINQSTSPLDNTINQAEQEIKLLNEYLTRLMSDVVTGKLDVRDAAAALPEIDLLTETDNKAYSVFDLDADIHEVNAVKEEIEA